MVEQWLESERIGNKRGYIMECNHGKTYNDKHCDLCDIRDEDIQFEKVFREPPRYHGSFKLLRKRAIEYHESKLKDLINV